MEGIISNSDDYQYYIVEFIKRGRQGVRSVDIVPSKWVTYNKKENKFKTLFMNLPYDGQSRALLQNMIKNNENALDDWLFYNIRVVARAKSYAEALIKYDKIENQRFAFTTESEVEPEEQASRFQETLKTNFLHNNLKKIKLQMASVLPIEVKSKSINDKKLKGTRVKTNPTLPKNIESVPDEESASGESVFSDEDTRSDECNRTSSEPFDKECTFKQMVTDTTKGANEQAGTFSGGMTNTYLMDIPVINLSDISNNKIPMSFDTVNVCDEVAAYPNDSNLKETSNPLLLTTKNEYTLLRTELEDIKQSVQLVIQNQTRMLNLLQNSGVIQTGIGASDATFEEKYSLNLPCSTVEQFEAFNLKLTDKDVNKDFIATLYFLSDRKNSASKSITNILKKYMTRDLAIQYTAQKQTANKQIIKDTLFYKGLQDMILKTHRSVSNNSLTEREVLSVTGIALTNAKDWDGHRNLRKKSAEI